MAETLGNKRLRVLFVTPSFPDPPDSGGKIRTAKLLQQLRDNMVIVLVSPLPPGNHGRAAQVAQRFCAEFHPVPDNSPRRRGWRFYARVLSRLPARYPVAVLNDYSSQLAATVRRLLASRPLDLAVCDYLQTSLNLEAVHGRLPTLLFQHNVESVIWKRHASTCAHPLLRSFWRLQSRKMERFEREACRRFDGVVAVSDLDRETFERFGARRVFTIPPAVDTDYFRPADEPPLPDSIVFAGAMDWLPNEDAVVFFVEHALPLITARRPAVRFTVVGRNPSPRLLRRLRNRDNVTITGPVSDVRPHVRRQAVCVVPLRIGGGTRIKIFEAMAMGKAIVSTSVGVEGLPVSHGKHLLIADTPTEFADAVVALLQDPALRARLEHSARALVAEGYSWSRAAAAFQAACEAVAGWPSC